VGNRLGWLIAGGGVLVLVLVVGLLWLWPDATTEPTAATTARGRLDRIDLPASIWDVVEKPTERGLAADDYNKGVVEYYDSDGHARLRKLSPERQTAFGRNDFPYRAHDYIAAGAKKRRMDYFAQYIKPAEAVKPSQRELISAEEGPAGPLPHLQAFAAMADAALVYGKICEKDKKRQQAEGFYKAVLVFGHHVTEDRVRLWGFQVGLDIQQKAAHRLSELYYKQGQKDRLEKVRAFLDELARVQEVAAKKAREAVFRLSERGHLHAGDLRNIAAHDADPMWRIEAIRQLGLCRAALSTGGNRADHEAITELLTQCKGNPNPFIQAAAELALGMTVEDVRAAY